MFTMLRSWSGCWVWLTLLAFGLSSVAVSAQDAKLPTAEPAQKPAAIAAPKIQLALLLDTSNSMDGLINQARTQLWKVVNEFAKSKRQGLQPILEVALFEYGNNGLPASEGYIRLVVPFTTDLDKLSQELFALKTNGGEEFCGQTIAHAVKILGWSKAAGDLRCIFIAGNEPFTQGPVDYNVACKAAADAGITVSTIHCGPFQVGVQTGWADGAKLADGSYMSIDADQQVADVPTPHDQKLTELSSQLNSTYVAYGDKEKQKEFATNQAAQDANAASAGAGVAAGRANAKASGLYCNDSWDLVDGLRTGKVKLDELKEEQLPAELCKIKPAERKAWVEKKGQERVALQDEIKKLAAEREIFIANERKKQTANTKDDSLDAAIIKATREQAEKRGYKFE